MAQRGDGDEVATSQELMKRYGMTTAQGMTRLIRAHLAELNADGQQHAQKVGKEWHLDAEGIQKLDEIRGLTQSEALQNVENAEIRALTENVSNLKVALLHAQQETMAAQKQVQQAQQQVLQAQAAILQEKDKLLAMQEQKAAAETTAAKQAVRLEAMQQQMAQQAKELQEARQAAVAHDQALRQAQQEAATHDSRIESLQRKAADREARLKALQQELDQARQQAAQAQEEAQKHRDEQDRLAHASLWQRITGKW